MKVIELLESDAESLLKIIMLQRLDRHEPVKLDFIWDTPGTDEHWYYRGYVTLIRGNTVHSRYTQSGASNMERFVLPPDVDDVLTIRKVNGQWLVQKI